MNTCHGLKNFNNDGEYIGPYIPMEADVVEEKGEILELLRTTWLSAVQLVDRSAIPLLQPQVQVCTLKRLILPRCLNAAWKPDPSRKVKFLCSTRPLHKCNLTILMNLHQPNLLTMMYTSWPNPNQNLPHSPRPCHN